MLYTDPRASHEEQDRLLVSIPVFFFITKEAFPEGFPGGCLNISFVSVDLPFLLCGEFIAVGFNIFVLSESCFLSSWMYAK